MRRITTCKSAMLLLAGLAMGAAVTARQALCQAPSLGAIARQYREQRAREKPKSAPLFTNDNLGTRTPSESSQAPSRQAEELTPPQSQAPGAAARDYGEQYFREKAQAIRSRLEFHQRLLSVLEQQWGLARTEYFADPQKTLEEESTPQFHEDLTKLRGRIAETQQEIAADQKAMDGLREELRRRGGDPAWLR